MTADGWRGRSFLKELDHTPEELRALLDLAATLKAARREGAEVPRLAGRNVGLVFEKTSTRTRLAFEIATADQGARLTYLDPSGSHLGHKESVEDTGRVMGRFFDAIAYRGRRQADIESLAAAAGIPVYNALTDEWHPTQMLADFLTMRETSAKTDPELRYAFVGDLRFNMGRSLLVMGALLGCDVRLVGPASLSPPPEVLAAARAISARTGARITLTESPRASTGSTSSTPTSGSRSASRARPGASASRCCGRSRSTRGCSRCRATPACASCTACRRTTTSAPRSGAT
jgi:ornithine carbamoyltransferase